MPSTPDSYREQHRFTIDEETLCRRRPRRDPLVTLVVRNGCSSWPGGSGTEASNSHRRARSHEDVVVAFDRYEPTNWQAHLVSPDGDVLLAFPWHDNADRTLLGPRSGDFPIHADEEAWDALEEGWWAWVKADGPYVYIAECDGDMIHGIRRTRKLEHRSPGLVAVGNVEFS